MPNLANVTADLARPIKLASGETFKGIISPLGKVGEHFNGVLAPRLLLHTSGGTELPAQSMVEDAGLRYFTQWWSAENISRSTVKRTYVLFAVTDDLDWQKQVTTTEVISGLSKSALVSQGAIPVVKELLSTGTTLGEPSTVWKILTNRFIQKGDLIGGFQVKLTMNHWGLTYGEIY